MFSSFYDGHLFSGVLELKSRIEKLAVRLKTPKQVQKYIRGLKYNKKNTLYSAETALRQKTAHCCEAAFIAASILEKHGYPPMVISFESQDGLDHVIYIFQSRGKWGSIAQSRDEGLYGRAPVYRSLKDLAWSYFDPYVDETGLITAYQVANLDDSGANWRSSKRNVWKAEKYLLDIKHRHVRISKKRHLRLVEDYVKKGPIKRQKNWW